MAMVGMIRLAPTVLEMVVMEQQWATAIPARSISLAIVAPQRVQVPHVEVRMTASTPSAVKRAAISFPNRTPLATEVAFPTVA